jgi:predicted transcriptional regulator
MEFKSFEEVSQAQVSALPLDANLAVADFEKMANIPMTHLAFDALDLYKLKNN